MRILYVSQYFPPEMGAPSARVHELSREWVRQGHEAAVITAFPHHPTGNKAPGDRWKLTRRENVDGIDVIRTYVWAAPNKGTIKRMMSYASFMLSAMTIGRLRASRPDVVIGTSPQLLCAVGGYVIARTMSRPFVFEVRDLWPEGILAVGAIREGLLIRILKRVVRHLYDRSALILTVGEGYRTLLREKHGVPDSRMGVVPNGIEASLFQPGPRDNDVRKQYGWGDRFVAMYVGTHGMAHGLDMVLETASRLRAETNVLFVFVGEGAEKENLKQLAERQGLDNVQFIDQQPRERIPEFYSACDVGVVVLRDLPLHQGSLPSKIFEYWGMERPILLGVGGDAQRIVEDSRAGECVPSGDVEAMVRALRRLSTRRDELIEMGRRGRRYVLQHYDRKKLAGDYLEILRGVAAGEASTSH
jgi:glycosyltransferase involved in cell wall biosynthesis